MRMVDILSKKRAGGKLTGEEIRFFVQGYTDGSIPDYQAAALAMAVCLVGMDREETALLTDAMAHSGDMVDLSAIPGVKVDKHSTGGVGDKTTLIVGPIVAALGVPVAKMSGRGLGHTGGTIDKLESIPGFRADLSLEEFLACVRDTGISVVGQTGNLAPADKKLYALRDVTATVDSIPLIASSVMSKKIAAGADALVLDVKTGSGAFMGSLEEARALAAAMVDIGESVGRRTVALVTGMDVPLGHCIGNALEVWEAVHTLLGQGPEDLTALSVELAANMLHLAGMGPVEGCRASARRVLADGSAFAKLREMVGAQGGDTAYLDEPDRLLRLGTISVEVTAKQAGYITHMDAKKIGVASMLLGAGRADKDSAIDYGAGILLLRKTGERVSVGSPIARLYAGDTSLFPAAAAKLREALEFGGAPPQQNPLVRDRIDLQTLRREVDGNADTQP